MDPLLIIGRAISMLRRVEKQQDETRNGKIYKIANFVGHCSTISQTQQNHSQDSINFSEVAGKGGKFKRINKGHLFCEHCQGTRHTKEGCFELIGYSPWWIGPRVCQGG